MESLDEEFAVPEGDGAVGEGSRTDLAGKFTLDTTKLVLKILGLLAKVSLGPIRSDGFDGVTNALDFVSHAVSDDGEVIGKGAVIVDEQDVLEPLCGVAANELSNNL